MREKESKVFFLQGERMNQKGRKKKEEEKEKKKRQ
jgi:hypothetical protein